MLAPRELSPDQRFVLHTLVERAGDPRSAALFALGYWAGCRVSDVSWLQAADVHLSRKQGWLHTGHKGGKQRDLDSIPRSAPPSPPMPTRSRLIPPGYISSPRNGICG